MVGKGFPDGSNGKSLPLTGEMGDLSSIPGVASLQAQKSFPGLACQRNEFKNLPNNELICSLVKQNKTGKKPESRGSNEEIGPFCGLSMCPWLKRLLPQVLGLD